MCKNILLNLIFGNRFSRLGKCNKSKIFNQITKTFLLIMIFRYGDGKNLKPIGSLIQNDMKTFDSQSDFLWNFSKKDFHVQPWNKSSEKEKVWA